MYYKELLQKIHLLLDTDEVKKALDLINEELSQPYVPLEVEHELLNLRKKYTVHEEKQINIDVAYHLNNLCLKNVLAHLHKVNLRNFLTEIDYYLANSNEYFEMTLLLLLLQEQAVNQDFIVNKGEIYTVNPSNMEWFTTYDSYKDLREKLQEHYRFNPSYFTMALEYIDAHYIEIYPKNLLNYRQLLAEVISILN